MTLVCGALITLLVTSIITESYIFGPVRGFAHKVSVHIGVLFSCFLCMGTWVGVATGLLLLDDWQQGLAYGLAFQGLAYLLHTLRSLADDARVRLQR